MKNLFIVNDDSVRSPGLLVLIKSLEKYNLTIVTTKNIKSWTSKAITYRKEVKLKEKKIAGHKVYVIDGFPADCVNIGLNHLVKNKPDLVVSGINIGENANISWTLSSATLAAVLEGAICGVKGIAFSQQLTDEVYREIADNFFYKPLDYYKKYFELSGRIAKTITEYVLENDLPPEIKFLNINMPPDKLYRGYWCITKPYQWFYGSLFKRKNSSFIKIGKGFDEKEVKEKETDMWALQQGYISITPYDLPMTPVINKKIIDYFSQLPKKI